jgi:predicted nuclease of restriction endonuclease-like (RecB) superfamily/transcriptional regulator with XRE-family HTH domain
MIKSLNAQAISDALSRAGLSPAKLAEQLNVSREAVSKWLHGESIPKPDKLLRLGMVLGLKLEELVVTAAPEAVPIVSARRNAARQTRDVHLDNIRETGKLLKEFVDYLPEARLTQAAVLKEASSDYDCVQKVNATPKSGGVDPLIAEVRNLIQSARRTAGSVVDTLQVRTNFEIGRRIVEYEQKGKKRAGYGQELLKILSARLTGEFGMGFSRSNLEYMRKFFLIWQDRVPRISQQAAGKLMVTEKCQQAAGELALNTIIQQPAVKSMKLFTLSWTHYVCLLGINDSNERSFYEIEATQSGWSVPELKRQKASCLYERLALSRDNAGVKRLAEKGQIITKPEDVLKEPLVLEFLGLDEKAGYSETDLESALINHLEKFLLELGKGFLFEARQKRFTFDEDHYFLDLVFYNRLLRCYVVIDLKLDKLTHQDLGQMQMYVNYYDRHVKLPGENPTIGLLLCKEKKDAVVRLTLPADANIHAKEYQLYLPSKELLRQKLLDWARDV